MKKEVISQRATKAMEDLNSYTESIQNIDSFSELPGMDHNPFTCLLGEVMRIDYKTEGAINGIEKFEITDRESGEIISDVQSNIIFRRKEIVDKERFSKIYGAQLKEMFNLSHPSLKVYGYFLSEIGGNKDTDYIYFSMKDCLEFCGYSSHVMVYKGLTELIKKLFISKTNKPPQFWVNPRYAFNGNRIAIFKEYVKDDYFEVKKPKMIE
jgi:hypothetical protein